MVSLNPVMVDGTGMCGGCRVKIGDQVKFACVDGPDFDGHQVDFDDLMARLGRYRRSRTRGARALAGELPHPRRRQPRLKAAVLGAGDHRSTCGRAPTADAAGGPMATKKKTIRTIPQERTPMPRAGPEGPRRATSRRSRCGYRLEDALREAERCLHCADEPCVRGCPVGIDIPGFIQKITEKHFHGAYDVITDTNLLPSVCGRVCPQENQCEGVCTSATRWSRWRSAASSASSATWRSPKAGPTSRTSSRPATRSASSAPGPAGMACAADMAKAGCDVIVYEAFHQPGGVLKYGIPDFRLPNERDRRRDRQADASSASSSSATRSSAGCSRSSRCSTEMGFHAVFIGTGAGYPSFMGIPGESLNGVLSANELLTRCNLMRARDFPNFDTPLQPGKRVAVIGAGNTAMDAMRVSLRLGAEKVLLHLPPLARRRRRRAPRRSTTPSRRASSSTGSRARSRSSATPTTTCARMRCVSMELGEPDESGRRRPVPVPGSEFEIETDMVVFAIGTNANPILGQTSKLKLNKRGYIATDETSPPRSPASTPAATSSPAPPR